MSPTSPNDSAPGGRPSTTRWPPGSAVSITRTDRRSPSDGGDNQEETFPGQSVDQLRQHLATDLRTYKPNVVLLQIDVANDLSTHSGLIADQEASRLKKLLDQIYYTLPNTTVLVGDPAPSRQQAIEDEIYTGKNSYIAQSDQVVVGEGRAGHRIRKPVPLDFEHDISYLDTGQPADGVPNSKGYQAMAADYAGPLWDLEQNGTIVDPGAVVVNPPDIIEDGSGIDDTGEAGGPTTGRPCDIYDSFETPCAEAVSTTRALYSDYNGPLYQVQRASDRATKDIGLLAAGGYADAAAQDSFCAGTTCVITKIYDQSPLHNDLTVEGKGGAAGADHAADAATLPVTIDGHKVYGINVTGQVGYRNNSTKGIAAGADPEGMYMVASGTHVNSGCCFDFGNAETSSSDTGNGHMDAVNLGTEPYLPAIGDDWTTQDLSDKYHTPPARQAPTALVHYDADGGLTWTSVYTVNSDDNHLRETYLSGIGASWITQDFTTKYGTPPAY